MHELSIAYSLIELAEEQLRALPQPVPRVERVGVLLGAFSGVAEEALHFCFDAASRGTLLEGAALDIEQAPLRAFCPTCTTEQILPSIQSLRCPVCFSLTNALTGGRELQLSYLEVYDEPVSESESKSESEPVAEVFAASVGGERRVQNAHS
jgi:hydrogenase nickel incorporation protein HypA/HybF